MRASGAGMRWGLFMFWPPVCPQFAVGQSPVPLLVRWRPALLIASAL